MYETEWHYFPLFLTFGNAECVITTGHEIVECHKQVGVILAGSSQQVFFGVPTGRFCQTLTLKVWSLKSFWKKKERMRKLDHMQVTRIWGKTSKNSFLKRDWGRSVGVCMVCSNTVKQFSHTASHMLNDSATISTLILCMCNLSSSASPSTVPSSNKQSINCGIRVINLIMWPAVSLLSLQFVISWIIPA